MSDLDRSLGIQGTQPIPIKAAIESKLSTWASLYLAISLFVAFVAFVVSGFATKESSYDTWAENGFSGDWIGIAISAVFQGVFIYLILEAGAEIVRLLKRLNGLPYEGEISATAASRRNATHEGQKGVAGDRGDFAPRSE